MDRLPLIVKFFDDESVESLVHRLADRNGFRSSWEVLRYFGESPCSIGRSLKATVQEKLSQLSGVPLDEIAARSISQQIHTQFLGRRVRTEMLGMAQPRICLSCAREKKYHRQIWLLTPIEACPYHNERLTSRCPTCNIEFRRYRPHLFTCQNGHNILDSWAPSEAISGAETLVARILYEYFGRSSSWTPELPQVHRCFRDFDFNDFMSVATLCGSIVAGADKRKRNRLKFMTCELADGFKILQDWPNGFRKIVAERIDTSPSDFSMTSNLGLRIHYSENTPGGKLVVEQIRKSMSGKSNVFKNSSRLMPLDERLVSCGTLMGRLGTTYTVIRRAAKKNGWKLYNKTSRRSFSLRVVDIDGWDPSAEGSMMTPGAVMYRTGLGVRTIDELTSKGAFGEVDEQTTPGSIRRIWIPEKAVAAFEAQIISASERNRHLVDDSCTSQEYFRQSRWNLPYSVADLLLAMAMDKVRATGAVAGKFRQIRYSKRDLDSMADDDSIRQKLAELAQSE